MEKDRKIAAAVRLWMVAEIEHSTESARERLAIDDASVENACMRYIPGSHQLGHLTYTLSENDEANVLNQTGWR